MSKPKTSQGPLPTNETDAIAKPDTEYRSSSRALHRIGNEINSLGLILEAVDEQIRESEIEGLFRAIRLIAANKDRLAHFLTNDRKGIHLPDYLMELGGILKTERHLLLADLEKLKGQVEDLVRVFEEERHRTSETRESAREAHDPSRDRP